MATHMNATINVTGVALLLPFLSVCFADSTPQALPHMSAADASFYGIAPCVSQQDRCVSFLIYTISFCYSAGADKRCSRIRARPFEYTSVTDCTAQVRLMVPSSGIGWYECEASIVSQQVAAAHAAGPSTSSRGYTIFFCRTDGTNDRNSCQDLHREKFTSARGCFDAISALVDQPPYKFSMDYGSDGAIRMHPDAKPGVWYECDEERTSGRGPMRSEDLRH